jgi:hypothetical protein
MRIHSARQEIRMQVLCERITELQEENLNRRRENLQLRIQSAQIMLRVRQGIALQYKKVAPVA